MTPLDLAYVTVVGGLSPWLVRRLLTSSKGRANLFEKLTGRVALPKKIQPRAWFHGVSVGEIHLFRGLLPAFRKRRPDVEVVVSSTTETGLIEAKKLDPASIVIPWPFDFSWAAGRALANVQPDLLVLAESELWPGMLLAAERRNVPVVVINARLSPKSAQRWRRAKPLAGMLFNRIAAFAAQTPEYAECLASIGVDRSRIAITGSLKYDGVETNRDNPETLALARLFNIQSGEIVWVAGSTQAPEEDVCLRIYQKLRAHQPNLRLILVPRQKERFAEVAGLLKSNDVPFLRRSEILPPLPRREGPGEGEVLPIRPIPSHRQSPVILVDTIGELRAIWGLADIAFVGGSLDGKRGGQNMIEPAGYGSAVLFGSRVWNFQATVDQLLASGGAVQVRNEGELEGAVNSLLPPVARHALGRAAQTFVQSQQGATERTLDVLEKHLMSNCDRAAKLRSAAIFCT